MPTQPHYAFRMKLQEALNSLPNACTQNSKMVDACVFSGGDTVNDVIVLSSDESQDEENKVMLLKPKNEAKRKVRRRLLQSKEITKVDPLAAGFDDRDECNILQYTVYDSKGEDSDNGSLADNDDVTVTQFESPTKKVFTPTKKPRIDTLSDCSDDGCSDDGCSDDGDEAEKKGHIRCLLISYYSNKYFIEHDVTPFATML